MALVASHHLALENHEIERRGMSGQIVAFQNEVSMLGHSSSTPALNDAVNQSELMSVMAS